MKARASSMALLVVALAIIGVVVFLLLRGPRPKGKPSAAAATEQRDDDERREESAPAWQRHDPESPPTGVAKAAPSRIDRQHADEVREKMHQIFADAGLAWGGVPLDEPEAGPPVAMRMMPGPASDGGDQELHQYIRDRMHEDFFPMAKACYTNALAKDPTLRGKIVLQYRIVGDPKLGGVVDTSELGDGTDIRDPGFNECMQQSMLAVSFDAPPDGTHEISVSYPIEFSPDDDDAG